MRTLKRNKQKIFYALYEGEGPEYKLDNEGNRIVLYTDEEGNVIYDETGATEKKYSVPVSFYGNIAMSSGEVQAVEFGVDVSNYDAILVVGKDALPLTETSLIWFYTKPQIDAYGEVDENSADFSIVQIKPSLNETKYILKRLNK